MPRLNKDHVLKSTNDQYRIIKYLGEGLTAIVYEAERLTANANGLNFPIGSHVAVKVLQEGLPDDIRRNFRDEADVIAKLSHEETKAGLKRSLIPNLVEQYLGSGAGPQFLAMEFVQGTPLDRRVREGDPLSEQMGLQVADSVLTVLDLLHTQLHKSYTDFQLQNVWLLPDQQNIKIMDWNHVSREQNPLPYELVDADLRRMGAYLYQILTGKGAIQDGETAEALSRRAGKHWDNLSVGTRHLIRRSLNPNPANRFRSAAEFRDRVLQQHRLWEANTDSVVDEAQTLMRPVTKAIADGSRLSTDELTSAETWVDMADRRHRGDQLVQYWKETISKATRDVSATWGSGMQLFGGKQYREAAAILRNEASSWGRADLWRQVMTADAAVELGDGLFQSVAAELIKVVDTMNSGNWEEARELFGAPPLAAAHGVAIGSLRGEIDAQIAYQAARPAFNEGRWNAAARDFHIVNEALPKIAYAEVLRTQYGWDGVDELAAEAKRLAEDVERGNAQIRELTDALSRDLDDGLAQIQDALLRRSDSPEIIRLCEREAERRPASEAQRLLLTALTYGAVPAAQEVALKSAYKENEERIKKERLQAEAAQREAAEAHTREEINSQIQAGRWAETAGLLGAIPLRLSDNVIDQVRSAFDAAVDGENSRQAREIAAVLDVVEPGNADVRRGRLEAQQTRQKAATDAWQTNLPNQVQGIIAAGQFDEARERIHLALPLLPEKSPITSFLRKQEQQIDEFTAAQTKLDDIHDKFSNRGLGPDDADKALNLLDGRIAALGASLTPAATQHLKDSADALRYDVRLRRLRNELDEAVKAISAKSYDTAESKLADAETVLNSVPSGHPGFSEQQERLTNSKSRLERERSAGKKFWDRFGKWIFGALVALALVLAAGAAYGLVSANRERDVRATTESALATTDANYNFVFAELEKLRQPNINATQTVEAFQTRAATDAAALIVANAAATALVASNEGLSGTVTAAQTTPEPLNLVTNLVGAAPVTGTIGEDVPVFYDLPISMNVTAPPDWSFQIDPERGLQLVDPGETAHTLRLVHTSLSRGTTIQTAVPASSVQLNPDTPHEATIALAALPVVLPNDSGHYRLGWEAVAADDANNRRVGASVAEFEIISPPTVMIESERLYRTRPLWEDSFMVPGTGDLTVEVLGKLDLADEQTGDGKTPPVPDFLMIRLRGSREIFWLPSWNAVEYYDSEKWQALLDSLPEVSAPDA